jgi:hypothetical protein
MISLRGCIRAPRGSDAYREPAPRPAIASALFSQGALRVQFPKKEEWAKIWLVASVFSLVLLAIILLMRG